MYLWEMVAFILYFVLIVAVESYSTPKKFSLTDFFQQLTKTNTQSQQSKNLENVKKLKADIKKLAVGTENGIKASNPVKTDINSFVKDLEALNPTKRISDNKLLDGKWRLIYTTNEGSSAGKIGPFVGIVTQDIDQKNSLYKNTVQLFKGAVEANLGATWSVNGPNLWTVKFLDIQFLLFGLLVSSKPLNGTTGNA
jgi:hypothetical protein